jgi:electron transfer flavoprotein beta subunit
LKRIAVCVKHVVDETEMRIDSSGHPILQGAATKMSTFDKNSVEEALRIKTKHGGEIVIFTVGDVASKKSIKEGLAMGADKGVLVVTDPAAYDSLGKSFLLAQAVKKFGPFDVVMCSEGSSDTYECQVPPMLGEWLSLPYTGYANKIEIGSDDKTATVGQLLEDCEQILEVQLPFVASVVSEINEPRYPTLIQIMQASKKPIEEVTPEQLDAAQSSTFGKTKLLEMKALSMNRKRVILEGSPDEAARKLVDALKAEGVVIVR